MNTQSHAVINLFLLRRLRWCNTGNKGNLHLPIVVGAILPDLPVFFFFAWYSLIDPTPQDIIWRSLYFDEKWQLFFNLFNSIPIYTLLALTAYYFSRRKLFIFSLANLLHFVEDFFLHMEDAHDHFFPLSNYRFNSAISYWDSEGYGHYVASLEAIIVVVLSVFLFKKLKRWWGKTLLILANLFSFGSHAMWSFIFSYF